MTTDTPEHMKSADSTEKQAERRHARGNLWITSWTTIVTASLTLAGTLATLHVAPGDIARKVAPKAEVTQTVVRTVMATVTATATATVTSAAEPETTDTPTSGAVASSVYLADLDDQVTGSHNGYSKGSYAVNGHEYAHSVALFSGSVGVTSWVEYTVDGSYSSLKATLGLNDEISTESTAEFAVYGNGKLLKKVGLRYARQVTVSVPVAGLVKLRIATTRTGGGDWRNQGAVFGDALLSR